MAWECFWFEAFFLFLTGVIRTEHESKLFSSKGQSGNNIHAGCPMSRVFCETWGFFAEAHKRPEVAPLRLRPRPFKVRLNLFQSLTLSFRQEPRRRDKVNHRAGGKSKEHRGISILADRRKKNRRNRRRHGLIEDQCNAHAVGSNARRHQL